MSRSIVNILPIEECRIIKQIIIVSEVSNKEISIGYILYEREFSEKYKFSDVSEEEKKDFLYYLDFPKQKSYPKDNVDSLILQSVLNKFPKSFVKNYTLISSTDQERIATLQNIPTVKCILDFTPDFSKLDLYKLVGKQFDGLNFSVNLYSDLEKEQIQNQRFFGNYDLEETSILDDIQKIKFL
jgi:hypothetical protein